MSLSDLEADALLAAATTISSENAVVTEADGQATPAVLGALTRPEATLPTRTSAPAAPDTTDATGEPTFTSADPSTEVAAPALATTRCRYTQTRPPTRAVPAARRMDDLPHGRHRPSRLDHDIW